MNAIECPDREAWLDERKNGLGASECAAALGLNPHESDYTLWARKCGLAEGPEETLPMWLGTKMEPIISDLYQKETGVVLENPGDYTMFVHPEHPWLRATLDRIAPYHHEKDCFAADPNGYLVELKALGERAAEDMRDDAKLEHQIQLQIQMACYGADHGQIAALIGNRRFEIFDYPRRDDVLEAIIPRLEKFWQRVLDQDPPPADGSVSTAQTLRLLHPDDNGETVVASPEVRAHAEGLRKAKEQIKGYEAIKQQCENKIKAAMGDAMFLDCGTHFMSWKTSNRKGYTVEPTKLRTLRQCKAAK
jgi:putative phage-type endonuclease